MTENPSFRPLKEHNKELNNITIESITQALLILMDGKDYNSITISEICKKAGVSRNAFYKNFGTKQNVLRKIVFNFNRNLLKDLGNPFNSKKINLAWYINFFEQVKQHCNMFKMLIKSKFENVYLQMVNDILIANKNINDSTKFKRLIWNGAIQNVTLEWIKRDMQGGVDQVAHFCYEILN